MMDLYGWFTTGLLYFNVFVLIYVMFINGYYLLFFVLSIRQLRTYMKRLAFSEYEEMSISELTPPVSIIVPAYNEEVNILDSIMSYVHLNYPEFEVIVVNDGSGDTTLNKLIDTFELIPVNAPVRQQITTQEVLQTYRSIKYPFLVVIDKLNGGKADALNAGINASQYPYYCAVDADSILERDALIKTMRPFVEGGQDVIACGGIIRIANGCKISDGRVIEVSLPKKKLALHQIIEYLRSFLMGRLGFSGINNLLIISGAFGVFRKHEILQIGGYDTATVGEDMELVIRLQTYLLDHNIPGKVLFVPDPVCWTEAPESIRVLYRQRVRWHIGLIECLKKHRSVMFNPKYKTMGIIAMPYFLLVELWGPVIELIGTIMFALGLYLDVVNVPFAILFLIATFVFGIFLSMGAVFLEEMSFRRYVRVKDLLILTWYSVLENFWYRQLNAIWRTWAFVKYMKKDISWGHMERRGLNSASRSSTASTESTQLEQ